MALHFGFVQPYTIREGARYKLTERIIPGERPLGDFSDTMKDFNPGDTVMIQSYRERIIPSLSHAVSFEKLDTQGRLTGVKGWYSGYYEGQLFAPVSFMA